MRPAPEISQPERQAWAAWAAHVSEACGQLRPAELRSQEGIQKFQTAEQT